MKSVNRTHGDDLSNEMRVAYYNMQKGEKVLFIFDFRIILFFFS